MFVGSSFAQERVTDFRTELYQGRLDYHTVGEDHYAVVSQSETSSIFVYELDEEGTPAFLHSTSVSFSRRVDDYGRFLRLKQDSYQTLLYDIVENEVITLSFGENYFPEMFQSDDGVYFLASSESYISSYYRLDADNQVIGPFPHVPEGIPDGGILESIDCLGTECLFWLYIDGRLELFLFDYSSGRQILVTDQFKWYRRELAIRDRKIVFMNEDESVGVFDFETGEVEYIVPADPESHTSQLYTIGDTIVVQKNTEDSTTFLFFNYDYEKFAQDISIESQAQLFPHTYNGKLYAYENYFPSYKLYELDFATTVAHEAELQYGFDQFSYIVLKDGKVLFRSFSFKGLLLFDFESAEFTPITSESHIDEHFYPDASHHEGPSRLLFSTSVGPHMALDLESLTYESTYFSVFPNGGGGYDVSILDVDNDAYFTSLSPKAKSYLLTSEQGGEVIFETNVGEWFDFNTPDAEGVYELERSEPSDSLTYRRFIAVDGEATAIIDSVAKEDILPLLDNSAEVEMAPFWVVGEDMYTWNETSLLRRKVGSAIWEVASSKVKKTSSNNFRMRRVNDGFIILGDTLHVFFDGDLRPLGQGLGDYTIYEREGVYYVDYVESGLYVLDDDNRLQQLFDYGEDRYSVVQPLYSSTSEPLLFNKETFRLSQLIDGQLQSLTDELVSRNSFWSFWQRVVKYKEINGSTVLYDILERTYIKDSEDFTADQVEQVIAFDQKLYFFVGEENSTVLNIYEYVNNTYRLVFTMDTHRHHNGIYPFIGDNVALVTLSSSDILKIDINGQCMLLDAVYRGFNYQKIGDHIYFVGTDRDIGRQVYKIADRPGSLVEEGGEGPRMVVFPNPAADRIILSYEEEISAYQIFNSSGQLIKQGSEVVIDIADFPEGWYFVSVEAIGETIPFVKMGN